MTLRRPIHAFTFPDPREADAEGLVAVGGDLHPQRVLTAYAQGIFPWPYDEATPLLWFSPDPRMVLRPDELHVSKSLQKVIARQSFEVRFDTAFDEVIRHCAAARRPGQRGTWITKEMVRAYERLHAMGVAHSAEAWREGTLVGGLYGVSLGAAFFGESMFALCPNASKVAFVHLVRHLHTWKFHLVDCQVYTGHLARFGAAPWRARSRRPRAKARGRCRISREPDGLFTFEETPCLNEKGARSMAGERSPIPVEQIEHAILLIRGQKVMLDADLAGLYGVTVGRLNEAVKRNRDRFPADFMFQLAESEFANLKSQIAISSFGWGGRRHPPYAFTEQGVAMLSSVLKSTRAVQVNIAIMRAFVKLREMLSAHTELRQKLAELERKLESHDGKIRSLFDAIRQLMAPPRPKPRKIGFRA